MSEQGPTGTLIDRIRAGDAQAAAEFVRTYEPVVRSRLRVWLRMQDARLRRVFDSVDLCQSVLASFFVRAASGQYDLDQPDKVLALLVQMARNKLANLVSREQSQRRDVRRLREAGPPDREPVDPGPSPSEWCAGQELLEEFRNRLSVEERQIADQRSAGQDWAAIAAALGGTPDGRRMQLGRALDRVAAQLGLEVGPAQG
jgi:RNA polymerase sigma-70 factor (ECF subfamily)